MQTSFPTLAAPTRLAYIETSLGHVPYLCQLGGGFGGRARTPLLRRPHMSLCQRGAASKAKPSDLLFFFLLLVGTEGHSGDVQCLLAGEQKGAWTDGLGIRCLGEIQFLLHYLARYREAWCRFQQPYTPVRYVGRYVEHSPCCYQQPYPPGLGGETSTA